MSSNETAAEGNPCNDKERPPHVQPAIRRGILNSDPGTPTRAAPGGVELPKR